MDITRFCCVYVMFKKFNFNIKQAVYNVKRSFMTIITLALAISMIAGLFYYFDAFEREALRSSSQFDMFSDLNLIHASSTQQLECSNAFQFTDAQVYDSLQDVDLEVEATYKYQIMGGGLNPSTSYIYADHSNNTELLDKGLAPLQYIRFHAYQLDNNFYDSERFGQFFRIMES